MKYCITYQSRRTINFWHQIYNERGSYSSRGGKGRPRIGVEKKDQIEEMFKAGPRLSIRNDVVVVGVHHTTVSRFLRSTWKLFFCCPKVGQQLSATEKENRVAFAQPWKEKLPVNPNSFNRILFSDECSFFDARRDRQTGVQNQGFSTSRKCLQTPQSSPVWMVSCIISENEVICWYFVDSCSVSADGYKTMLSVHLFPKLANYPSEMIFNRMALPRSTQFRPENISTKGFQVHGGDGKDRFIAIFDLLTWDM